MLWNSNRKESKIDLFPTAVFSMTEGWWRIWVEIQLCDKVVTAKNWKSTLLQKLSSEEQRGNKDYKLKASYVMK